eukprot:2095427-Pyramimonas_sp.AAC.1
MLQRRARAHPVFHHRLALHARGRQSARDLSQQARLRERGNYHAGGPRRECEMGSSPSGAPRDADPEVTRHNSDEGGRQRQPQELTRESRLAALRGRIRRKESHQATSSLDW